ncbi:MAG TPA: alpha/beta fold hydrolase [Galbitalea sp.]|jgi:alpha-beta hydrolase superfamily lysophospholipase|nr:alpha/beta fold hydrolase [Galbitalea sp.]
MSTAREFFVEVETEDHLVLPGALIAPEDENRDTVVLWLHGFGSSYDYSPCLRIGRVLAYSGISFMSISARGYHGAVTAWQRREDGWGTKKVGSWFEVFQESALDITAWIELARSLGYRRVVLAGHSFGGVKVASWLAGSQVPIDGLILASPSWGIETLEAETTTLATAMVARGDGAVLLPDGSWPRGFGTRTVSAQTYASWAAAADLVFGRPADWQSRVVVPVLAFYGDSHDVGGTPELERMTGLMASAGDVNTTILPGVTHNYETGAETIADAITEWWRSRRESQLHHQAIGGSQ